TFQDCRYNSLSVRSATVDLLGASIRVHVPGLATDEGLINFDFSSEFVEGPILSGKANPLKHEPCGLLCHSKRSVEFPGANAILAVQEHPDGGKPLLKGNRRVLEDCASLQRERGADVPGIALPNASLREVGDFVGATGRTLGDHPKPATHDHLKTGQR